MDMSITGTADINGTGFQELARRQLVRAFGSFAGNIVRIDAVVSDDSTAEEMAEASRHCRLTVELTGNDSAISEASDQNALAAVIRAAERGRRIVIANLSHPRTPTV